jgi:hypothetical protein
MTSPQISNFEISTADSEAALQELKDNAVAELKRRIEKDIQAKEIKFTFRNLGPEARPGLVTNILWEVRADF